MADHTGLVLLGCSDAIVGLVPELFCHLGRNWDSDTVFVLSWFFHRRIRVYSVVQLLLISLLLKFCCSLLLRAADRERDGLLLLLLLLRSVIATGVASFHHVTGKRSLLTRRKVHLCGRIPTRPTLKQA